MQIDLLHADSPKGNPPETSATFSQLMARLLNEEYALYVATRDYRWEATGPQYPGLRQMLGTQAREIETRLDRLAWQIGTTGNSAQVAHIALPSLDRVRSSRREQTQRGALTELCALHESMSGRLQTAIIRLSRDTLHLEATGLLSNLSYGHEQNARALRTMLTDHPVAAA